MKQEFLLQYNVLLFEGIWEPEEIRVMSQATGWPCGNPEIEHATTSLRQRAGGVCSQLLSQRRTVLNSLFNINMTLIFGDIFPCFSKMKPIKQVYIVRVALAVAVHCPSHGYPFFSHVSIRIDENTIVPAIMNQGNLLYENLVPRVLSPLGLRKDPGPGWSRGCLTRVGGCSVHFWSRHAACRTSELSFKTLLAAV